MSEESFEEGSQQENFEDSPMKLPTKYVDQALPLIFYDQGKYNLNEEAMDIIRSVNAPLGIIAVAGMYRTGKSYLLNRVLLNRKGGFGVGPTINPCTKGMWIWGRPLQGQTPEGEPAQILVIDSEGLGAFDEDSTHDSRIFALTILIASYFIYNSVGSIDEDALQNLSLVVNLTQHIHLKAQNEEADSQEYSNYFPSFLWVLRDFVLQLVDSEGNPITSKEYLERALQPQKGFSDKIEEKNRIRRLLKDFFPDRDACTLVRPVRTESELQRLEELELEDLRIEFVEQVLSLKKKILNRIKPKTLHGKRINGDMLVGLLSTYIHAINEGVAPTIENAWSYICKTECAKALHEASKCYERSLAMAELPCDEEDLQDVHREAKEAAFEVFQKKAVGDSEPYLKELKQLINQKFNIVKMTNEKECRRFCLSFLQENYNIIDNKLKQGKFQSYQDFEREFRTFQQYYMEHGPQGPDRREVLLEFSNARLAEGSDFYIKRLNNNIEMQQTMSQNQIVKLESELSEIKEEFIKDRDILTSKLMQSESERTQLKANEQGLKEQLHHIKQEHDNQIKESRETIKALKVENQRQGEEWRQKNSQLQDAMKEVERRVFQNQSEHDQQIALLQQKNAFLENTVEEYKSKEKAQSEELRQARRESSQNVKEVHQRYEDQIKKQQQRIEFYQEKMNELEQLLEQKEQQNETNKNTFEEKVQKQEGKIEELQNLIEEIKQSHSNKIQAYQNQIHELSQQSEETQERLKSRISETEQKLKVNDENYKNQISALEKESAVLLQKFEFSDLQLEEYKQQLLEAKRQQESMVKAINQGSNKVSTQELQAAKEQYMQELQKLEMEYEGSRNRLTSQIQDLQQKNHEIEVKLRVLEQENTGLKDELSKKSYGVQEDRQNLINQIRSLNSKLTQQQEDLESQQEAWAQEQEKIIQEQEEKSKKEQEDLRQNYEQQLQQMKQFFEQEKARIEKRIQEDRERQDKKCKLLEEELEGRIREISEQLEEENEQLQEEMHQIQTRNSIELQKFKHQAGLDQQKIESLEKYLKETKEAMANIHSNNQQMIEQQNESFNKERQQLMEKLEKITQQTAVKDKELASLNYKREQQQIQLDLREKELAELKQDSEQQKNSLQERHEQVKAKSQQLQDELLQNKVEYNKKSALLDQQIEFQNNKIRDLEAQLNEANNRYEERLRSIKDQSGHELTEMIARLTAEKEVGEKKLEQKRKAFKELETMHIREQNQYEREKAVLVEKLGHFQQKMEENESRWNLEKQELEKTIKQLKDLQSGDKSILQNENIKLQNQLVEYEKLIQEKTAAYERDQILWENKHEFLVKQRDQSKADLVDHQRKFEQALEQIQKKGQGEKDKIENVTSQLITSVEARYQQQFKETQEQNQQMISSLNDKNKILDQDLRSCREELDRIRRQLMSEQEQNGRKIKELTDNEKRLMQEMDSLKQEKGKRLGEQQKTHESEKQQIKKRLEDTEQRLKEIESQKALLFIETEKERAKWAQERDHLISQRNDATDLVERLEKRKDQLLRENEKLKSSSGKSRAKTLLQGKALEILNAMSFEDYAKQNPAPNMPESTIGTQNTSEEKMIAEKKPPKPNSARRSSQKFIGDKN